MATKTTNYNLPKYDKTDSPNLAGSYNESMDAIDAQMKVNADTAAQAKELAETNETDIGVLDGEQAALKTRVDAVITDDDSASTLKTGSVDTDAIQDGAVTDSKFGIITTEDTNQFHDETRILVGYSANTPFVKYRVSSRLWDYINSKIDALTNWITTAMLQDGSVTAAKIDLSDATGTIYNQTINSKIPAIDVSSGSIKYRTPNQMPATTSTPGFVKPDGSTITVTDDGTISATQTEYVLPTATADTLGGVKVGDNLSITDDGVLSATASSSDGLKLAGSDNSEGKAYQLQNSDGTAVTSITIGTRAAESSVGNYSYAEGGDTTASGEYSHAEGINTRASGEYSHAEGIKTRASGVASHAEGEITEASGIASHAEGDAARASGEYSHAEGINTSASGIASHAEGSETIALGGYSHTEGYRTTAIHKSQHVFGEFNVVDTSTAHSTDRGDYVEIVGNGTSTSARSNARTLDWSGNEVLAGSVTASKFLLSDGTEVGGSVKSDTLRSISDVVSTYDGTAVDTLKVQGSDSTTYINMESSLVPLMEAVSGNSRVSVTPTSISKTTDGGSTSTSVVWADSLPNAGTSTFGGVKYAVLDNTDGSYNYSLDSGSGMYLYFTPDFTFSQILSLTPSIEETSKNEGLDYIPYYTHKDDVSSNPVIRMRVENSLTVTKSGTYDQIKMIVLYI